MLECDAWGVMFAEADCDADDFGDVQSPSFPCFDRFILESNTVSGVDFNSVRVRDVVVVFVS
jgi:benzyl alcohol O-benzoyltransferase